MNPKRKFSVDQFDHLKHLLESGTSILILLNEEGEKASKSNINYFLEEYGMAVNSDVVIRTSFVQVIPKYSVYLIIVKTFMVPKLHFISEILSSKRSPYSFQWNCEF